MIKIHKAYNAYWYELRTIKYFFYSCFCCSLFVLITLPDVQHASCLQ